MFPFSADKPLEALSQIEQAQILYASMVNRRKVLVLDLDETLVHSSLERPKTYAFSVDVNLYGNIHTVYVQKRPRVDEFLKIVLASFDVFIFTASRREYAVPVILELIPGFPTERVLTREYCVANGSSICKDLSIFQTDIKNIILVDNQSESFAFQPMNGLKIETWTDDYSDTELFTNIIPKLEAAFYASDVRVINEL